MKKKGRQDVQKCHGSAVSKNKKRKTANVVSGVDPSLLRGAGKRHRRPFNPHSWNTSIPTTRQNILCLGMSYPCVQSNIEEFGLRRNAVIENPEKGVDQAIELVRRGILTEMDGRDLARVLALEANNDMLAYTVSMEKGAIYGKRHLEANFNRPNFIKLLRKEWHLKTFRQVILDYFWIPAGSWAMDHWKTSFFRTILPGFVEENMLNFGDIDKDSALVQASEENGSMDFIFSSAAVVYLPFCSHCFREVVASYDVLSKFYTISFIRRDQLDEHSLWKSTNTISPDAMQHWLGKAVNQEEAYCKIKLQEILHGGGNANVSNDDVIKVFKRIDRREEVRMIKLTALRMYHPRFEKSKYYGLKTTLGIDKGGYVGLVDPDRVKLVTTTACSLPIPVEECPVLALEVSEKRRKRVSAEYSFDDNSNTQKINIDEIAATPVKKKARGTRHRVSEDIAVDDTSQKSMTTCTKTKQRRKCFASTSSGEFVLSYLFGNIRFGKKGVYVKKVDRPRLAIIPIPTVSRHHNSKSPKKFVRVLWNILANEDEAVSWTPSGDAFVIYNDTHFFDEVLPRYFGKEKYQRSNFYRYLSLYGFDSDDEQLTFSHSLFHRDGLDHCNETIAVWKESSMKTAKISGGFVPASAKTKQFTRRSNAKTEAIVVERIGNRDDCCYHEKKDDTYDYSQRDSLEHQTPDLEKMSSHVRKMKSRCNIPENSTASTTSTTERDDTRQLSFRAKLWKMVEEESESVVAWSKYGDSFGIKDVDCFSILLSKYLNVIKGMSHYQYFQKNLRGIGFRQDKRESSIIVYYHIYFKRNHYDRFIGATNADLSNAMKNFPNYLPRLNEDSLSNNKAVRNDNSSKLEEFDNSSSEKYISTEAIESTTFINSKSQQNEYSSENEKRVRKVEVEKNRAIQLKDEVKTLSVKTHDKSARDNCVDDSDGSLRMELRNRSESSRFHSALKKNHSQLKKNHSQLQIHGQKSRNDSTHNIVTRARSKETHSSKRYLRRRTTRKKHNAENNIEATAMLETNCDLLQLPFKMKLINILRIESCICWSKHGDSIIIKDLVSFSSMLKKYFIRAKGKTYLQQFQNLIKGIGFRQDTRETEKVVYYHKYFIRNELNTFSRSTCDVLKRDMKRDTKYLPHKESTNTFTTTNHNQFSDPSYLDAISPAFSSPTKTNDPIHHNLSELNGEASNKVASKSPDKCSVVRLRDRSLASTAETQAPHSMEQCSLADVASDRDKCQSLDTFELGIEGNDGSVCKRRAGEKEDILMNDDNACLGTDTPEGLEDTATTMSSPACIVDSKHHGDDNQLRNENMSSITSASELSCRSSPTCQTDQSSQSIGESRHSSTKNRFSATNLRTNSNEIYCFEASMLVEDGDGGSDLNGSDHGKNDASSVVGLTSSACSKPSAVLVSTKPLLITEGRDEHEPMSASPTTTNYPIHCDDMLPLDGVTQMNGVGLNKVASKSPDKWSMIRLKDRSLASTPETQAPLSMEQDSIADVASDRDKCQSLDTFEFGIEGKDGSVCKRRAGEKEDILMNDDNSSDSIESKEILAPDSSIGDRYEATLSNSTEVTNKQNASGGFDCVDDENCLEFVNEHDECHFSNSNERNEISFTIPLRCPNLMENEDCLTMTPKDSTIPRSALYHSEYGTSFSCLGNTFKEGTPAEVDASCSESNDSFDRYSRSLVFHSGVETNKKSSILQESCSSVHRNVINSASLLRKSHKRSLASNSSARTKSSKLPAHSSHQIAKVADTIENPQTSSQKEDDISFEQSVASSSQSMSLFSQNVQITDCGKELSPTSFRTLPEDCRAQYDCSISSSVDGLEQRTELACGFKHPQLQMTPNPFRQESDTDESFSKWVHLTRCLLDSSPSNFQRLLEALHSIKNDHSM